MSIWLWSSRCFTIPYSYNKHDTWFSLILYCCKQMWGVQRGSIFMVGPGRQLISLRHCSRACVDITSLVASVNLICAKKVYYSNRPKYFFLCVNSRITSKIFKTCFGQSEQVLTDETVSCNFAFWNSKQCFRFFKSLNLPPLNSKYLENS